MSGDRSSFEEWHNGGDAEIRLYAKALRNAAKTLMTARIGWDACPIGLIYRQALEIHLKLLVGEGSNFLTTRTDPISLATTHSLRWLAQIVCPIVRAVGWGSDFTCEGVSSLADFSALVNVVESFDPVVRAIHTSRTKGAHSVSEYYRTFDIEEFGRKLDGLLDLLDATAGSLAARWEHSQAKSTALAKLQGLDDSKTTIQ